VFEAYPNVILVLGESGIAWRVSTARKQGITLGINGVFGSIGSSLAPIFFGGLMIDLGTCGAASSHVPGVGPGTVIYLFRSQNRVTL
jgi:hypothetical protein